MALTMLLYEARLLCVIAPEQRCVFVQFARRDVERATECTRKARRIVEPQSRGNVLYAPVRQAHQLVGRHPQPAIADIRGQAAFMLEESIDAGA